MIKSYKELASEGYTQTKIKTLLKEKKLFKLDKGYYSDQEEVSDFELISFKYPNAVITLESALHIYFDDYYDRIDA